MKTIFVVDDDPLMREMLARTLQNKGFRVRTFATARALLERFEFEFPQLIISDIQMPGMTGLELLELLRSHGSEVPVMLMTAHLTPEIEERARPLAAERLIAKPLKEVDRLVNAIRAVVGDETPVHTDIGLDEVRSTFLTDLAHELRTPLTAIKIALDNLFARRGDVLSPEGRRMANIGRRNLDRIIKTVEQRLDGLPGALREEAAPAEADIETGQNPDEAEKDLETIRSN